MLFKILGVLFALFVIMFVAIVVEETLIGGRRRRRSERKFAKSHPSTLDLPRD